MWKHGQEGLLNQEEQIWRNGSGDDCKVELDSEEELKQREEICAL